MKTAVCIKELEGWRSDARLYELSEPAAYDARREDGSETKYVIVSAVDAMFSGPETYIFPATEDGESINMGEMDGSFRGDFDHDRALRGLGYEPIVGNQEGEA